MPLSKRKKIKHAIKKTLVQNLGFEIKKVRNRYTWLKSANIKTIIDIGANEGQFLLDVHYSHPDMKWIVFEPIPSVFEKLKLNTKHVSDADYHQVALGANKEKKEINVNEHSPSSSFLDLNDLHIENYDFAVESKQETVEVARLDDMVNPDTLATPYAIKLDVQGFEEQVIAGGQKVFSNAQVLLVESGYQELYQNQPLFDDLYMILRALGFRFCGNLSQSVGQDGFGLYADALFVQKELIDSWKKRN